MGEGVETNVATLRLKVEPGCSIPVLREDEVGLVPLVANCGMREAQSA